MNLSIITPSATRTQTTGCGSVGRVPPGISRFCSHGCSFLLFGDEIGDLVDIERVGFIRRIVELEGPAALVSQL